ncbi:MAG TPA: hypothetical protein GXX28_09245, partial [Firmicutes bacterium]|nr:hypothetical protein [Bacillota bacterium]
AVADLLRRTEWKVTRSGKGGAGERLVDIRPYLLGLAYLGRRGEAHRLAMRVRTGSTGGARPEEYLPALGRFTRVAVERTEVWLSRQGALVPALPPERG